MKQIGGFFELEMGVGFSYHPDAIKLSTGRACIRLLLKNIDIKKCYVPYYSCDALYDPFLLENIDLEYYEIDSQFNPISFPDLNPDEYLVYINYFGIKTKMAEQMKAKYKEKLILDNTHVFFDSSKSNCFSFTSARKYFGIPDGAFLYSPIKLDFQAEHFMDFSIKHNVLRALGKQNESYSAYLNYEASLNSEIYRMSLLSEGILSSIKYEEVKEKRKENFSFVHSQLKPFNQVSIDIEEMDIPFAYPFLPECFIEKSVFHSQGFFIPSLWLDPVQRNKAGFETSIHLGKNLIPVPIDHRYSTSELKYITDFINSRLDD